MIVVVVIITVSRAFVNQLFIKDLALLYLFSDFTSYQDKK